MSFADVALESFPARLWMLDGVSPFVDSTGLGSTATTSSTGKHAALIKGASSAVVVDNTNKLSFDVPIMKRGHESSPFSIEVTIRPIRRDASVAQQQIFGTASAMDGLVIAGTVLSFTTRYTNTGEARCEFDLQEYRAVTVAVVHTEKKNSLFVNGDLVDEVTITDEQQADTYLAAGTSLTSGTTTSANALALNGLAIYTLALDDGDIEAHYEEAADNMDEFTVAAAYGATVFAINSSNSTPIVEYTYDSEDHWNTGRISGVSVQYGQLTPQAIGTTSIAGTWETIIPLPPDETLSSITLNWQGEGEIVETSTDGNSWTRERRSAKISSINEGFQTNNGVVMVRVSFPGGIENDKSYFDDLVITAYGPITTVMPYLETRTLSMTNGSIEADFDITEYNENWGIELVNGSMSLSGSSATAIAPKTIQVWAKKADTSTFSDNLQANATNWYTNNGTYQQEYQTDEWQLRTYTFASGHQLPITFTGTGQIGCILLYDRILTTDEIEETYTAFTGTKSIEFATSGTIGFTDLSQNVDIYEYDWSIESAG